MSNSIFSEIRAFNQDLIEDPRRGIQESSKTTDCLSELYTFGNNIYELFDSLVTLFNDLGIISTNVDDNKNKFRFIHAYPDHIKDDGSNVITYSIVRRTPRVTQNSSINSRSVTKSKPTAIGEQYNTVTGSVDEFYKIEFDNVIAITLFSNKARVLNNLSRIIESIFLRYSSYIKKSVDECIYLGMSDIRFIDRYDEQDPIYSRELQFKVLTTEVYRHELEQVKSINVQLK